MAIYPEVGLDDRVPDFLDRLFKYTDDRSATEEYVSLFTDQGVFKCGRLFLQGKDGTAPLEEANCRYSEFERDDVGC